LPRPAGPRDASPDDADPDLPLLRAIAGGDGPACRALVDRYLPRLHALATRLLGDMAEAEDACQDVFVQAWKQAPRWRPGRWRGDARFGTWLHGVTLNACRDRLRRRRPQADAVLEEIGDDTPGPAQRLASEDTARAVRAAIAGLPERQREALVLCHYQELPQAEAAALLGVSVEALESLLARARRNLRQSLAPLAPMGESPP
jgi:RNA polymerase sigma factor (sigma-70 family)